MYGTPLPSDSQLRFGSLDAVAFRIFIFPRVWTPEEKPQRLFTSGKAVGGGEGSARPPAGGGAGPGGSPRWFGPRPGAAGAVAAHFQPHIGSRRHDFLFLGLYATPVGCSFHYLGVFQRCLHLD